MAKFKISDMEVKLGVTLELDGKWVRVDKGVSAKNLDLTESLTGKELHDQFEKCENLILGEIERSLKNMK